MAAVLPGQFQLLSWLYLVFFCSLLSRTLSCGSSGSSGSSSGGNVNRNPYYTSHSDLNNLYNKRVTQSEKVSRPLNGILGKVGVRHEGVRVTTQDGEQWLVHKGDGFGGSGGDTVVVPADAMSNRWRVDETRQPGNARVGDYVESGGRNYDLLGNNCQHAADRMMCLKKK